MLAIPVILLICAAAFGVTMTRGVAMAFAYVLLPTLLVFFNISPIEVNKLPDITPLAAVSYGTLLAVFFRGYERNFAYSRLDALVLALVAWKILSALAVDKVWTGVSTFGTQTMTFVIPYFMARTAFYDREARLASAKVIVALSVPIALIALIEMRLRPLFFSRFLADLGLSTAAWVEVLRRFGLFRAQATFGHPIDLGNGGALVLCLLACFATTVGRRLTTPWVALGVGCGGVMVLASMSFTSYVAVAAIAGLFAVVRLARPGALLLAPLFVAAAVGYAGLTLHFANTEIDMPTWEEVDTGKASAHEGSLGIRHLIVKRVWPDASEAGLFGYGKGWDVYERFGLLSIDNAYMLFIIEDGWGYLILFLMLGLGLCLAASRAALRLPDGPSRTPLAAGVGGIVGTMMGMYTVFFGFVYGQLLIVLTGVTISIIRQVAERTGAAEPYAPPGQLQAFAATRGR